MLRSKHPKKSKLIGYKILKKINEKAKDITNIYLNKKIIIIFQDEAEFERIDKAKYCCCNKKIHCHHIRQYIYTYREVEPKKKENYLLNAIL